MANNVVEPIPVIGDPNAIIPMNTQAQACAARISCARTGIRVKTSGCSYRKKINPQARIVAKQVWKDTQADVQTSRKRNTFPTRKADFSRSERA